MLAPIGSRQRLLRSIDTNIVLRLLVRDMPAQTEQAKAIVSQGVTIGLTVLLEVCWVLTSRYRFPAVDAAEQLIELIDLPEVTVEAGEHVRWALRRFAAGADAADMIHLVSSRQATAFVTFDRRLARRAGPDTPVAIELPS